MDSTHGNICENWYIHKEFIHATTRVCMITAVLSCDWFTPRGAVQRGHVTFCQSEQPASKVFFVKFGRTTESMVRRSSYLLVWIRHPWLGGYKFRGTLIKKEKDILSIHIILFSGEEQACCSSILCVFLSWQANKNCLKAFLVTDAAEETVQFEDWCLYMSSERLWV